MLSKNAEKYLKIALIVMIVLVFIGKKASGEIALGAVVA